MRTDSEILTNDCLFADYPRVSLVPGHGVNMKDIKEGEDVYLECKVKANPRITNVKWYHNVSSNIINHEKIFQINWLNFSSYESVPSIRNAYISASSHECLTT